MSLQMGARSFARATGFQLSEKNSQSNLLIYGGLIILRLLFFITSTEGLPVAAREAVGDHLAF